MLQDFGVISADRTKSPVASRHDLVHALEDFLSSLVALDAHTVVIVDEAQHLRPDVLEQIRLLSNIDAPKGTMLQIILSGQLDLESLLARPELRQVQQRVSRRIRLERLGEGELQSYIDHRLAVGRAARSRMPGSGELARALEEWNGEGTGVTFTADAVQAVWRWSAGLPRVINVLCDRALEEAYAHRVRTVDTGLVERAAALLQLGANPSAAASAPTPAQDDRDVASVPDALEWSAPATRPRATRLAAWAAGLAVVGAVVGWSVARGPGRSASGVVVRSAPPPDPPRAASPAAAPMTAAPIAAPPPASIEPGVVPPQAMTPVTTFEIIVASFRTEERAAAVMFQVTDAGLPVRQRVVGGWHQVLAGPFSSREEADAGRLRLERAGLPGTQVVSTHR
jgi:type II secretory pathway predicted ATPase ExeA/cell division septation protein DedD